MTRVAVVIVNWNGARDTIDCVRSLQQIETGGARLTIVVTDNDSSDNSIVLLDAFFRSQGSACPVAPPPTLADKVRQIVRYGSDDAQASLILVAARSNGGFAAGNNIGVDASRLDGSPDFIWFLNSDAEANRNALLPLLSKMADNPDIGMCGSTLIHASDKRTVQSYGGSYYSLRTGRGWSPGAGQSYDPAIPDSWVEDRINYVSGAAMFVRRAMFDQIGPMSEAYFLYNEEIDLSCRAAGRFRLGVATDSVVYHRVGASIGTEGSTTAASRLSTFYQTRSKLLFAARHTRSSYPLVWLTLLARALKFYRAPARRPEARVILQVLRGRRTVDPQWFAERRRENEAASEVRP